MIGSVADSRGKLSMKRKIFALVLACALASSAMAGCGGNDKTNSSVPAADSGAVTESRIGSYSKVVQYVGSKPVYCAGSRVFIINDDDTCTITQVGNGVQYDAQKASDKAPNDFGFSVASNSLTDTDAYGTYFDNSGNIYHWDLTDPEAIKENVLYSQDKVIESISQKAAGLGLDAASAEKMVSDNITDMLSGSSFLDGGDGFLYKTVNAFVENQDAAPVAFCVMSISRNGDSIDFVGDIRAGSLAVGNGFMYYYDGGYTYDKTTGEVSLDSSKAGLYRSLTDGSGKTALISGMQATTSYGNWADKMKYTLINMRVINTEVFYIDNSENGDHCLYKISTDGGTPEKVSEHKCADYYYNRAAMKLYYFDAEEHGRSVVYEKDMNSGAERALFIKRDAYTSGETMGVCGDNLYIADASRFGAPDITADTVDSKPRRTVSGQRYNLKTGELENLYCTVSYADLKLEGDSYVYKGPAYNYIFWEKQEPESTADGTAVY